MANKNVKTYHNETNNPLLTGAYLLAKTVSSTIGPKGRNVMFKEPDNPITITNDGATIAENFTLYDREMAMGAKLLSEAALKTNSFVGDGTTTSTVITESLLREGFKFVTAGSNAVFLKNGMDKALAMILNIIDHNKQTNLSNEDIKNVARTSSNDYMIADLIAEAMTTTGESGMITVNDSVTNNSYLNIVQGAQFEKGFESIKMADDTKSMKTELTQPLILVTDYNLQNIRDIVNILEIAMKNNKPLLIIAENFQPEVLTALVMNKNRRLVDVTAVKAPGINEERHERLTDLAILTGAAFVSSEKGITLTDVKLNDLGSAEKCIITKEKTAIIGGSGSEEAKDKRINELKKFISMESDRIQLKRLYERSAFFTSSLAEIFIGSNSVVDTEEKKARTLDAVNAVKSAQAEGIVAGGGLAYIKAELSAQTFLSTLNDDELRGAKIVFNSLSLPYASILKNAGIDYHKILDDTKKHLTEGSYIGFDVEENKWVNFLDLGVVDSAIVIKKALESAVSLVGTFLTMDGSVIIIPGTETMFDDKPDIMEHDH